MKPRGVSYGKLSTLASKHTVCITCVNNLGIRVAVVRNHADTNIVAFDDIMVVMLLAAYFC